MILTINFFPNPKCGVYSFGNPRLICPDHVIFFRFNIVITNLFFLMQGRMLYWAIFEGKTHFDKLWLSFDKRGKLDLRLTKIYF